MERSEADEDERGMAVQTGESWVFVFTPRGQNSLAPSAPSAPSAFSDGPSA